MFAAKVPGRVDPRGHWVDSDFVQASSILNRSGSALIRNVSGARPASCSSTNTRISRSLWRWLLAVSVLRPVRSTYQTRSSLISAASVWQANCNGSSCRTRFSPGVWRDDLPDADPLWPRNGLLVPEVPAPFTASRHARPPGSSAAAE